MNLFKSVFYTYVIAALVLVSILLIPSNVKAASCIETTDYGSVTTQLSISETGSYRLWSRLQNPAGVNSSYLFEINNTCINVGGLENSVDNWSWVDYQDGNKDNKTDITLEAGDYQVRMIGNQSDVLLDRVLLIPDNLCEPKDTGDSCMDVANVPGDVNGDKVVDIFDLSAILSNWEKEGAIKSQGDLNEDGVVNIFDLSTLLTNWGKQS